MTIYHLQIGFKKYITQSLRVVPLIIGGRTECSCQLEVRQQHQSTRQKKKIKRRDKKRRAKKKKQTTTKKIFRALSGKAVIDSKDSERCATSSLLFGK
jgi:hypothetical protein